jgi:hypothetical protein
MLSRYYAAIIIIIIIIIIMYAYACMYPATIIIIYAAASHYIIIIFIIIIVRWQLAEITTKSFITPFKELLLVGFAISWLRKIIIRATASYYE